jgi:hypothetical protein
VLKLLVDLHYDCEGDEYATPKVLVETDLTQAEIDAILLIALNGVSFPTCPHSPER